MVYLDQAVAVAEADDVFARRAYRAQINRNYRARKRERRQASEASEKVCLGTLFCLYRRLMRRAEKVCLGRVFRPQRRLTIRAEIV
jgi:hypothetical protein